MSLFGNDDGPSYSKFVDVNGLGELLVNQLKTVFPSVCPKFHILKNSKNAPLFLLVFASASNSPRGQALGLKIAKEIIDHDEKNRKN